MHVNYCIRLFKRYVRDIWHLVWNLKLIAKDHTDSSEPVADSKGYIHDIKERFKIIKYHFEPRLQIVNYYLNNVMVEAICYTNDHLEFN